MKYQSILRPSERTESDSDSDFSVIELHGRTKLEKEKQAHAETRKQLEVSREQNVEIHGKNLDLQALNESQSRNNDRLVLAQEKMVEQLQALNNENFTLKEQLKNEKLLHKATQSKLRKLNTKQRYLKTIK